MGFTKLSPWSAFAALLLLAPVAQAQVESPERLDAEVMLPCDGACPVMQIAVPIDRPVPKYPAKYLDPFMDPVEAFVQAQFMVGADGRVSDIQIITLVGPHEFATSVRNALRDWVYKPAIMNGKPVAGGRVLSVPFFLDTKPGARREIVIAYNKAAELLGESRQGEAEAVLVEAQKLERLSFYERGMMANLLARIALQKNEYRKVRQLLVLAPYYASGGVPTPVARSMWQSRIIAELSLGDIGAAVLSLARMREMPGFDPADPIIKLVSDTRSKIENLASTTTPGLIPEASEADGFLFGLHRRRFAFTNVAGALFDYRLVCREHMAESPITERAEWSIPKSMSDCSIFVRGRPGTSFDIVQFRD